MQVRDFALVVLQLLIFKFCGIIGISESEFFNFSSTERVKQNNEKKKIQNDLKSPKLVKQSFFKQFQQNPNIFFLFFTENLTLYLPVSRPTGPNTELPSKSNISKTVRVNIVVTATFFKGYSISFQMICRLRDFARVVLYLLMFKVCGITGISRNAFFKFCRTERVKAYHVTSNYLKAVFHKFYLVHF